MAEPAKCKHKNVSEVNVFGAPTSWICEDCGEIVDRPPEEPDSESGEEETVLGVLMDIRELLTILVESREP
jgi:hypothetical protein